MQDIEPVEAKKNYSWLIELSIKIYNLVFLN